MSELILPTQVERPHTRAVYAGSFDLLTNGHVWVIEQGARLFTELEVAVGVNPEKSSRYMFSDDERTEMLEVATEPFPNVTVTQIGMEYTVSYARKHGFDYVLRGARNAADYANERTIANVGRRIRPGSRAVESVVLLCPVDLEDHSSSMVKGLIGYVGWEEVVAEYVPKNVFESILEWYADKQNPTA